MTFDLETVVIGAFGFLAGWTVRSAIAISQIRSDLDKMQERMTETARRESQHSVAGIKQVIADHDESIRLHGERLTSLTVRVEQLHGR